MANPIYQQKQGDLSIIAGVGGSFSMVTGEDTNAFGVNQIPTGGNFIFCDNDTVFSALEEQDLNLNVVDVLGDGGATTILGQRVSGQTCPQGKILRSKSTGGFTRIAITSGFITVMRNLPVPVPS